MEIRLLDKFPRKELEHLLSAIPFFNAVKQQDPGQLETLLQFSRVICFRPSEVVLQRGDGDNCLYFLLKGRLTVYPGEVITGDPINYVTPGEVFGDLAMLTGKPRSATIVTDSGIREAMVFALDFARFGDLTSIHPISLNTKLIYYRNTVHSLRWKLDVYRSKFPNEVISNKHRHVKLYTGAKDSIEELQSLHYQAIVLADLLLEWNSSFGLSLVEHDAHPGRGSLVN